VWGGGGRGLSPAEQRPVPSKQKEGEGMEVKVLQTSSLKEILEWRGAERR